MKVKSKIVSLLLLISILFLAGCEEKMKPVVTINPKLILPISCMNLNRITLDPEITEQLNALYPFDETCPLTLSVSYKKDIVCNSTQNIQMKNMGKFPKSYLKLELREGLEMEYTYYVDLYSNIDKDDIEEGFAHLKKDLLKPKGEK